jgi:adenine-specific DNA methylase
VTNVHDQSVAAGSQPVVDTVPDTEDRLIDVWFPCPEVDAAVSTPAGSGRSEKALFTWFASRPIAQARAAVLCSLLPDTDANRADVRLAVLSGDDAAVGRLRARIANTYGEKPPVVLDIFSGRGIIPLEAARLGVTSVGTDLSPVATLAGRILADYPLRDWSTEPDLPFTDEPINADEEATEEAGGQDELFEHSTLNEDEPRLLADVRRVLTEVGRRVRREVSHHYSTAENENGGPWAYLWAVTIPCDGCGRRFPLIGSMVLRHPYGRTKDGGQSLRLKFAEGDWSTEVDVGLPSQEATFNSPQGRRGKVARCPFPGCGASHSLDVVKAKGFSRQYLDALLAVGEIEQNSNRKIFRPPTVDERSRATNVRVDGLPDIGKFTAVPDEAIPPGNRNSVGGSGYGYLDYGSLMNPRQALLFSTTARVLHDLFDELRSVVSDDYARALVAYAAANVPRQLRYSTRGANLRAHGNANGTEQNRCQAGDVFASQSVIKHQFDYLEAGPWAGPGTWSSVASSLVTALRKVMAENGTDCQPGRFRRSSATALPFRDGTVDVLVTDPPYYDMIAYADASDIFYVWFKRMLANAMPDLFDGRAEDELHLQDKTDEIIVKGRGAKGAGDHRSDEGRYERLLAQSFREARRVLKDRGHLTVIFGHSDPEAWKRLLQALTDAGFVVTSSWPSRTETAVTGVATISVTVSIGARVAPEGRPVGIAAQVDAEVVNEVRGRCSQWDLDGLALEDQLMASYGAALQVVGRYIKVIAPTGETVQLEHYMTLARRAVRDAIALRLDEQPLETFDPHTRLAVFWQELYNGNVVPKGEARFFAQSDELRLEDLRGPILEEVKAGFRLRHDAPGNLTAASSAYEVVRGIAAAYPSGTDAVAACLATAERSATDGQVWALVDWLGTKLPTSDPVHVALAAVKRNKATIQASVATQVAREEAGQPTLFEETS